MEQPAPDFIDYVIFALMLAVLVVLIRGVIAMVRGKDAHQSNRMMVWRVTLQGLALILCALFLAKNS